MCKSRARSRPPGPSQNNARWIPLTALLALACSGCAQTIAPYTPSAALLRPCLIDLTGSLEVDGPALEKALQDCDSQIAGLRVHAANLAD